VRRCSARPSWRRASAVLFCKGISCASGWPTYAEETPWSR
jgi:hypothetical protein